MKHLSFLGSIIVLLMLVMPAAHAAPPHITTVSWILSTRNNLDVDDKVVTLVGRVYQRDGGSDWWFTDGTGSVRLDSGDFDLPAGPQLRVKGRIDHSYLGVGYLEVDVKNWSYADKDR